MIAFWRAAGRQRWFNAQSDFDAVIRDRFGELHAAAASGKLAAWEENAAPALALILVTDQFARNIYRGSAHAFATDELARNVADRAISHGFDRDIGPDLRSFFYLPFEHHEDLAAQDRSVALFETLTAETGQRENLDYALLHRDLIARFGRFPHRNAVLGRVSTPQEIAYLAQGGFAG